MPDYKVGNVVYDNIEEAKAACQQGQWIVCIKDDGSLLFIVPSDVMQFSSASISITNTIYGISLNA